MARIDIEAALGALDDLTRRLREECPWDREQDARSIVPHTLEEAYELAEAVHADDDRRMLDELGDVLFQVHFLSLLMEERGAGDLAAVAEHCRQKLIRRHPHVFAEVEVRDAGDVLRNWDQIKRAEPGREGGIFGEIPANLPALLYARKVQRRARSAGIDPAEASGDAGAELRAAAAALLDELPPAREGTAPVPAVPPAQPSPDAAFDRLGALLFALVDVAGERRIDPELALRVASDRFRNHVASTNQRGP